MAISHVSLMLMSALRRAGSRLAVEEVPDNYFLDSEEVAAWHRFRDHVREYRAFPGPQTFRRLTGQQPLVTTEPLNYYVDDARRRYMFKAMTPLMQQMGDAMRARAPEQMAEFAKQMVRIEAETARRGEARFLRLDQALDEVVRDHDEAMWSGGALRGITSGWEPFDRMSSGHMKGDLNTFVGRPGRGKTYVLLYQAWKAWLEGNAVVFVSMELAALQLARRLVGLSTGINPNLIKRGLSTPVRQMMVDNMQAMRNGVPFYIVVGGMRKSVPVIKSLFDELNPDAGYIDASYLLTPEKKRGSNSGRRENVADVVEELKQLALDTDRPIIQSVQFNRQAVRHQPRAQREGGDQEQEPEQRQNPVAHLSLERIGETDVVGQASSIVIGVEKALAPFENSRRVLGFLKGREGEHGYFTINYGFNPVNLDYLRINDNADEGDGTVDLAWMR